MEGKSIGLVIAMPEEVRPIARRLGRCRKERIDRFPFYRFRVDGREIDLVQSGMGTEKAAAAAAALIAAQRPGLLVSAGLGGGIRKGLATGDVVLAGRVMSLREDGIVHTTVIDNARLLRDLAESLPERGFRILDGCVITGPGILRKKEATRFLPDGLDNPVLDMETRAVAEAAARDGIPFLSLRAVSDAADEEIPFSIEEITDRDMNISILKVLSLILKNPQVLPRMIRLAKNAKTAGDNLALVLEKIILTT